MHTPEKINNFTVSVRLRPSRPKQLAFSHPQQAHKETQYKILNKQTLLVSNPTFRTGYGQQKNRKFVYDRIFESETNRNIFKESIQPQLHILDKNYNLTVFTYGVTGSGKTYTVFGDIDQKEQGVAMLAFEKIMDKVRKDKKYFFTYMQIYNEQVNDLLVNQEEMAQNKLKSLQVLEDINGNTQIPELTKIQVNSPEEIKALINRGNSLRACSSNLINKMSSRSHAILQLYIQKEGLQNCLTVIDLAGSQKIPKNSQKYDSTNTLQKQGSNINKSLLSLANCIKCLQENKTSHIPYRDSKLTRILKADLSGKAYNVMIACIGRQLSQIQQTINTLQYASKAKKIEVAIKKTENLAEKAFYCEYCGQGTQWQSLLGKIPKKFLASKEISTSYKKSGYESMGINLKLNEIMKDFRDEIMNNFQNQLEIQLPKTNCDNLGELTNRSASSLLFSFQNKENELLNCELMTEGSKKLNLILQNLKFSLSDLFELFEEKIREMIVETGISSSQNHPIDHKKRRMSADQAIPHKIQYNMPVQSPDHSSFLFETQRMINKISQDKISSRPRIQSDLVIKKVNNQERNLIYDAERMDTEISTPKNEINCRRSSTRITFPSLQQERQALLSEQYKKSSNLRKKVSIKPKNTIFNTSNQSFLDKKTKSDPQTANTTAIDFNGFGNTRNNFLFDQSLSNEDRDNSWCSPLLLDPSDVQQWFRNQRSHRMNPDAESDQEQMKVTSKQAIMKKLLQAKNKLDKQGKYEEKAKQIEVSSFELELI